MSIKYKGGKLWIPSSTCYQVPMNVPRQVRIEYRGGKLWVLSSTYVIRSLWMYIRLGLNTEGVNLNNQSQYKYSVSQLLCEFPLSNIRHWTYWTGLFMINHLPETCSWRLKPMTICAKTDSHIMYVILIQTWAAFFAIRKIDIQLFKIACKF